MNQLHRVVQVGIGMRSFVFHAVCPRFVVHRIRDVYRTSSGFLESVLCLFVKTFERDAASDHRHELTLRIAIAVNIPLGGLD